MGVIKSLLAAFAMYSRLPVPIREWDEDCKRYILCFFPLVGLVQGLIMWGISVLFTLFDVNRTLYGAMLAVAPVLINGGIHLDGFLDTIDAMNAYADKKRRLEILKDSHCGAFAVIYGIVYLILCAGIWATLGNAVFPEAILIFMISRTLSGVGIMSMPCARDDGSISSIVNVCDRRIQRTALVVMFILEVGAMCLIAPVSGIVTALVSAFIFWHYTHVSMKFFGGVTGDLAGYFLQLCELSDLAALTGIVLAVKTGV